jgi:hypothetical protein
VLCTPPLQALDSFIERKVGGDAVRGGRLVWCAAGKGQSRSRRGVTDAPSTGRGCSAASARSACSMVAAHTAASHVNFTPVHGRRISSVRWRAPQSQTPCRPGEIRVQGLRTEELPGCGRSTGLRVPSPVHHGCHAQAGLCSAPLLRMGPASFARAGSCSGQRAGVALARQPPGAPVTAASSALARVGRRAPARRSRRGCIPRAAS